MAERFKADSGNRQWLLGIDRIRLLFGWLSCGFLQFFLEGGLGGARENGKMSHKLSYTAMSSNIWVCGGRSVYLAYGRREKAAFGCTTRFCKPGMQREKISKL